LIHKNKNYKKKTVFVWDGDGDPPVGDWFVLLWSSYVDNPQSESLSMPRYVDENADQLKKRFLKWVYDLGESLIDGRTIVDILEIRPGLSYWWLTSIGQKFNLSEKSNIDNAIKLMAMEAVLVDLDPALIILATSNNQLARVLGNYCVKANKNFKIIPIKNSRTNPEGIARRFRRAAPRLIRALACFIWYLKKFLPISRGGVPKKMGCARICFIDVLVHLGKDAVRSGQFSSKYWSNLVSYLSDAGVSTNWIHNYYSHSELPSAKSANNLVSRFNQSGSECHLLLESMISLSTIVNASLVYLKLVRIKFYLSQIDRHFTPVGSNLNLWPLFKNEWEESLVGPTALLNSFRLCFFEKVFRNIPVQKLGIYIQENQPWEMILIHVWRANGHGRIIGVPHTTVSFWDLRYFYDYQSYHYLGKNRLPLPNNVAVNGRPAKMMYLDGGYPESDLIEVEALRYLHLSRAETNRSPRRTKSNPITILVCGDFSVLSTVNILRWVSEASRNMPSNTVFLFKPHPAFDCKLLQMFNINITFARDSILELVNRCDFVFTSSMTSSSVDGYLLGARVIQMLDGEKVNTSPLRKHPGVVFVGSINDFVEAIRCEECWSENVSQEFFHLDINLIRWKKMLGQYV